MTVEHFETAIDALMAIRPFQPFTIELNTGQRMEVDHQGGAPLEGQRSISSPGGPIIIFDHDSVNQIIDTPADSPGKRRK